jgi:hypothetical protein
MRPDDLPELGVVKTATPCSAKWDQMEGDDARRFCKKCELYVYDFSALTTNDARELLLQSEGRLCARIFTRADGTVLTKDCPVGLSRKKWKRVGGAAVAAALLGAVLNSRMAPKWVLPVIRSSNPPRMAMGGMAR